MGSIQCSLLTRVDWAMESLRGQLLIASRHLLDPNFVKTVILLIQHTQDGALGVVVNRPTSKTVRELWKEVGKVHCTSEQPVYLGGPVSGPLMAVHMSRSLAEIEIVPEVFFAATKENLDKLVQQEERPFKVFVGHAGWGPGQLDSELDGGAWLTMPATTEYLFYDGDDLWKEVSRQVGKSMLLSALKIKHVPDDPSMN